jgi:antitoxin (DNA-binding transcriptional repressor) of toxin-antitoxin stability system
MYMMKTYKVGMVRERLSQALDEAEGGEPVFIERNGVIYRLSVEKPRKTARPRRPYIEVMDPAVDAGQWTWDWSPGALRFRNSPKSRRKR